MARLFTAFQNTTESSMAGLGGVLPGMQAGAKMVREGERHAQQLELGQREIELADAKATELKTQQDTRQILQQSMLGDIPGLIADGEKVFGDASLNLDRSDLDSFKLLWTAREGALAEGASTAAYDRALQLKFGALEQQVRGARTQQSRNSAIRYLSDAAAANNVPFDETTIAELGEMRPDQLQRLTENQDSLTRNQIGLDALRTDLTATAQDWIPKTAEGIAAKTQFLLAMQSPVPAQYTNKLTGAKMLIDTPEEKQAYYRALYNDHLVATLPAEIQKAITDGIGGVDQGTLAAYQKMTDEMGAHWRGPEAWRGAAATQGTVDEDPINAALNLGGAGEGDGEVAAEPAAEPTVEPTAEPEAQPASAALGGESRKSSGDQDDYYLDDHGRLVTSIQTGMPGGLSDRPDSRLKGLNIRLEQQNRTLKKESERYEVARSRGDYSAQKEHEAKIAKLNEAVAKITDEVNRLEPLIAGRDAKELDKYTEKVRKTAASYKTVKAVDRELFGLNQSYARRLNRAEGKTSAVSADEISRAAELLLGPDNPNVPKFESPEDARKYEVLMERKRELGGVDLDAPAPVAAAPSGEPYKIEGMDFPDPSDATAWDDDPWVQTKHMAILDDKIFELEGELGTIKGRGAAARKRKVQNKIKALKAQQNAIIKRSKSAKGAGDTQAEEDQVQPTPGPTKIAHPVVPAPKTTAPGKKGLSRVAVSGQPFPVDSSGNRDYRGVTFNRRDWMRYETMGPHSDGSPHEKGQSHDDDFGQDIEAWFKEQEAWAWNEPVKNWNASGSRLLSSTPAPTDPDYLQRAIKEGHELLKRLEAGKKYITGMVAPAAVAGAVEPNDNAIRKVTERIEDLQEEAGLEKAALEKEK